MAQIAQQDNLFIHVGTEFPSDSGDLTAEVKAKLISCFKAGTILDVVLVSEAADGSAKTVAKCVGAYFDSADWGFEFLGGGSITEFVWNEE